MPFRLTPDDRFFYPSAEHARALSHLLFGLVQHEGFVVITGEVGAGKTTLVERLTAQLDPAHYRVATITTSLVEARELLNLIAGDFGVASSGDKASIILGLRKRWQDDQLHGRRALIVIDEAQGLPLDAIEELRMLSNLTHGSSALVQTIMLGQPQFRRLLASPDLDQLRQRVLASYHLGPLRPNDVGPYINHRLAAAGATRSDIFDAAAIDAVYRFTGGIPRRINRLCGRLLLNAGIEHADVITGEMVESVAAELEADLEAGSPPPMAIAPSVSAGDAETLEREGKVVVGRGAARTPSKE